jgi:hypothetical protein
MKGKQLQVCAGNLVGPIIRRLFGHVHRPHPGSIVELVLSDPQRKSSKPTAAADVQARPGSCENGWDYRRGTTTLPLRHGLSLRVVERTLLECCETTMLMHYQNCTSRRKPLCRQSQ